MSVTMKSVSDAFQIAISRHGPIDALVNNAGITQPGTIEETPLDSFRAIMETNYFGVLRCIKAVLPHMRARRAGCIVNISSVAGRIALAPQAAYVASKHALEAMSECLAQEVRAFNIRVALVEPGVVATPIFKKIRLPETTYPQGRRLSAFFAAMGKEPTPPERLPSRCERSSRGIAGNFDIRLALTRRLRWHGVPEPATRNGSQCTTAATRIGPRGSSGSLASIWIFKWRRPESQ